MKRLMQEYVPPERLADVIDEEYERHYRTNAWVHQAEHAFRHGVAGVDREHLLKMLIVNLCEQNAELTAQLTKMLFHSGQEPYSFRNIPADPDAVIKPGASDAPE